MEEEGGGESDEYVPTVDPEQPIHRGRGRLKGSKNKPKEPPIQAIYKTYLAQRERDDLALTKKL